MLLKLAARNIRRSVRDYAIYFVTLVFGVAVFYAFNSIESQQVLFDLESQASTQVFATTQQMLSGLSVFIAFVLGFLVVYANRFLIKRRKREFGTYLTLGMGPRSVSLVVLAETMMVGLASLAGGLLCGIVSSQALSFATASLFGVTMENYQFVFSADALRLTLVCFAVIYLVVAAFNLIAVNRCKLIDLLSAGKRNEKEPVRNLWASLAVFVVSLGVLALAYNRLVESGMVYMDDPDFIAATVLMLVGSFGFFWSLAGFAVCALQRARGIYLRGLTLFTVRQIASKINTAFVTLWVTCVTLFFSITIFSTGMGLIDVFYGDMDESNPFDATLSAQVFYHEETDIAHPDSTVADERARSMEAACPDEYADGVTHNWDMAAKLEATLPGWSSFAGRVAQIDGWELPGVTYGQLMDATGAGLKDAATEAAIRGNNVGVMALSQVNAVLELTGKRPLTLGENEAILANNMAMTEQLAKGIASAGLTLDACGRALSVQSEICPVQVQNNAILATSPTFIVPDAVIDDLRAQGAIPLQSYLNIMYPAGLSPQDGDAALFAGLAAGLPIEQSALDAGTAHAGDGFGRSMWPVTNVMTSLEMRAQAGGLRMMITYLAIYIGFVFLIATAAVLAIQQLSEAADAQPRYKLLARLGCDERMLSRSVLAQVLVYFLAPLALAACHSACAIEVMAGTLFDILGVDVRGPILMASILVAVVYGAYMLVTFLASRGIMRQAIKA